MNRLAGEDSLYLRQHATSLVDWHPWGPAAFEAAAQRDVPVLLSVGYSSCHWCHVMAREVFDNRGMAEMINASVVSVKVDKDERPEVDHLYTKALRASTGGAGWPMTLLLLPDQRPFFAATFLPRPALSELLAAVGEAWRHRRPVIEERAAALSAAVVSRSQVSAGTLAAPPPPAQSLTADPSQASHREGGQLEPGPVTRAVAALRSRFDPAWGGFDPGPKFPRPVLAELLLWAARHGSCADALPMASTTLQAMASGGIYDHLGGGFARYATDRAWRVPHFEKMLTDNAQLARVYLHAWKLTGWNGYRQVAEETLGYLAAAPMRIPGAGFASAQDAESGGVEGSYYRWQWQEIVDIGGLEAARWYGVTPTGNWQGTNVLWRPRRGDLSRSAALEEARQRLLAARSRREPPATDERIITEWNAMAVAAFAEAGPALGRPEWTALATEVAAFLLTQLRRDDGRWLRGWRDGRAQHLAWAGDYVWLIEAFTQLAEATGAATWTDAARQAADELLALFWDPHGGVWGTGSDAPVVLTRTKVIADGTAPSANGMAAWALARLGGLTGEPRYHDAAAAIVAAVTPKHRTAPARLASCALAAELLAHGPATVTIPPGRPDLTAVVSRHYLPDVVSVSPAAGAAGPAAGAATVCRAGVCRPACGAPATLGDLLGVITIPTEEVDA
jgi:uncharacterized protein YyaL (SSP411 family)